MASFIFHLSCPIQDGRQSLGWDLEKGFPDEGDTVVIG